MKTFNKIITTIFVLLAFSNNVQANLIQNGSFEDTSGSSSLGYGSVSTWQLYAEIPEWDNTQSVEIWSNNFIVPAYDGNNVLELNAHAVSGTAAFSISQEFDTIVGAVYELTFVSRKRQKNSDEAFYVSVGDLSDSVYNQTWGDWSEYSYQFTAEELVSTLTFTSLDAGLDTTGNIFDAITVTAVPEPGIYSLMLLGFASICLARKKSN